MVLLLAKQIITLYHAVQKTLMKDQHALVIKVWRCVAVQFILRNTTEVTDYIYKNGKQRAEILKPSLFIITVIEGDGILMLPKTKRFCHKSS